ncbi:hypothetical protein CSKR_104365 [Clonorchis sinensis]|uniref:Uncharacterized protein n=1 Tax=Clonorchis sinensis TaxID=79923 RepID=A0A419QDU2_CLOSI|nr:hypothetical protein CSKR_104365 [Clonorchis sinensis]
MVELRTKTTVLHPQQSPLSLHAPLGPTVSSYQPSGPTRCFTRRRCARASVKPTFFYLNPNWTDFDKYAQFLKRSIKERLSWVPDETPVKTELMVLPFLEKLLLLTNFGRLPFEPDISIFISTRRGWSNQPSIGQPTPLKRLDRSFGRIVVELLVAIRPCQKTLGSWINSDFCFNPLRDFSYYQIFNIYCVTMIVATKLFIGLTFGCRATHIIEYKLSVQQPNFEQNRSIVINCHLDLSTFDVPTPVRNSVTFSHQLIMFIGAMNWAVSGFGFKNIRPTENRGLRLPDESQEGRNRSENDADDDAAAAAADDDDDDYGGDEGDLVDKYRIFKKLTVMSSVGFLVISPRKVFSNLGTDVQIQQITLRKICEHLLEPLPCCNFRTVRRKESTLELYRAQLQQPTLKHGKIARLISIIDKYYQMKFTIKVSKKISVKSGNRGSETGWNSSV